jgi:hypothetical protein
MTQLEQNLTNLEESIYATIALTTIGYDISKKFLPEEEVVKNLILKKNKRLKRSDVEVMVDGEISKRTELEENVKNSAKSAAVGAAGAAAGGLGSTIGGAAGAAAGGLGSTIGGAAGAAAGGLGSTIGGAAGAAAGGLGSTIGGAAGAAAGGLGSAASESISGLGTIGVDSISGSARDLAGRTTQDILGGSAQNIPEDDLSSGPIEVNFEINPNDINIKKKAAKHGKKKKIFKIPKDHPLREEAKSVRQNVRQAVMSLLKEQKELYQELVQTSIKMGNSIAGAAVLIAPLSFNIPGAISLILIIIDGISKLISKILNIIRLTEPLKLLPLLIPAESFETTTKPINVAILTLTSIFSAVSGLQKLITKLLSSLKSKIDDQKGNVIEELEEQIAEQKEKRDRLKIQRRIDNKNKLIAELEERLRLAKLGVNLPEIDSNGQFVETSVKSVLESIDPIFQNQLETITIANEQLRSYVYDVYLPDGTVLTNIDESKLEQIKNRYNVIFENQLSD